MKYVIAALFVGFGLVLVFTLLATAGNEATKATSSACEDCKCTDCDGASCTRDIRQCDDCGCHAATHAAEGECAHGTCCSEHSTTAKTACQCEGCDGESCTCKVCECEHCHCGA